MVTPELLECGHPESEHSNLTTGYGRDAEGKRHCFVCCAGRDQNEMLETGKITLYLDQDKHRATNWPGSLVFKVGHIAKGRHNMARVRYDTWFTGPDGHEWHGVQFGDNTQLLHCKRTRN
jgi:hypothetical protein